MEQGISFILNEQRIQIDFRKDRRYSPTTTVLNYLRSLPNYHGVKEGCAEGDCGACTVVLAELSSEGKLSYSAVNSCLIFLPKLHGKALLTVENLKSQNGRLHPVQRALVETHASQCGFCTPGFVMSLYALYKSKQPYSRAEAEEALAGNLCRCTGYQPILKAAEKVLQEKPSIDSKKEQKLIRLLQTLPKESVAIKTVKQYYYLPANLAELMQLRKTHPKALLLNGATDTALRVTKNFEILPEIIDAAGVKDLRFYEKTERQVRIGGGMTVQELKEKSKEDFPALSSVCRLFGSKQIRHLATLGGNLGTASPIGDLLPVLTAYDGTVVLKSADGERRVPMDEFVLGYRKPDIKEDEIIYAVELPEPPPGVHIRAYKISRRKEVDISTVSAAFRLETAEDGTVKRIKLVYGGMAEITKRAGQTEAFLTGKPWNEENILAAQKILLNEFTPIEDARAGAEFRRVAAANLLFKFWSEVNI